MRSMDPQLSHVEDARHSDLVPSARDAPRSAVCCMYIGFLCLILEVGATDLHLGLFALGLVIVFIFFFRLDLF